MSFVTQEIKLGKWEPDKAPKTEGLVEATNVMRIAEAWVPAYGANNTYAISGRAIGLYSSISTSIGVTNWFFTKTSIYREDDGAYTQLGNGYSDSAVKWSVAEYDGALIAANYEDRIQLKADITSGDDFVDAIYNITDSILVTFAASGNTITASTAAFGDFALGMSIITSSTTNAGVYMIESISEDLTTITVQSDDTLTDEAGVYVTVSEAPFKARVCAYYKERMVYANLKSNDAVHPRRIQITATGTYAGTEPSEFTGAGILDVPGVGEEIVALHTSGDNLIIHMTDSVWALSFVGYPLWFNLTKVYDQCAAIGPDAVAILDNNTQITFGYKDLYVISAGEVKPIGIGYRKAVFNQLCYACKYSVSTFLDLNNKLVGFNYPVGNDEFKILLLNYEENFPSVIDKSYFCVGNFKDANGEPYIIASRTLGSGEFYVLIDENDNEMVSSGGDTLVISGAMYLDELSESIKSMDNAVITTGEIDLGDVAFVREVRPIIESADGEVIVTVYARKNDGDVYTESSSVVSENGIAYFRIKGRYLKFGVSTIRVVHNGLRSLKITGKLSGKK